MLTARRLALLALLIIPLSACNRGLSDLDREIDRLIQTRSGELESTHAPGVSEAAPPASETNARLDTDPSTQNPPGEDLSFRPAEEGRDVETALSKYGEVEGGARILTLAGTWTTAQRSAREFLNAEEEYILAAIRLLIERHRWSPRLFNDTSVTLAGQGDEGRYDSAVRVLNELSVTQKLPYGGDVAARWVVDATENLRRQAGGRYRQSSEIALDASIPLMRGAGNTARESLIQQERSLVYAARTFERFRRTFLVDIAGDYFALQNTKAQIANQQRQLKSLRYNADRAQELVTAGRLSKFRASIFENDLLRGRNSLESLKERYRLQLDRFKVRLGLSIDEPIDVADDAIDIPEPDATLGEVTSAALAYRLDLQNQRDQLDDARRAVDNARNNTLADLDLSASASIPTDPSLNDAGLQFDPDEVGYSLGVTYGLPLDREIERLQLRQAIIDEQRSERDYSRFRDDVVVGARAALRAVELARFQYEISVQQVAINKERRREQELRRDEVDPQTLIDAENDLLQSENARDQALTDLRNSILNYLVATGQLRVTGEGLFEPLPGMKPTEGEAPDELPMENPDEGGAPTNSPAENPDGG